MRYLVIVGTGVFALLGNSAFAQMQPQASPMQEMFQMGFLAGQSAEKARADLVEYAKKCHVEPGCFEPMPPKDSKPNAVPPHQ